MARLTTTHSASFGQGSFAGAWTAPVNTVTYPKAISKSTTTATKNVHKNSRSYKGETHVYAIRNSNGSINKIGESAQGTRVRDGASKRAEQQVRKLNREVGPGHTSEIRGKVFSGKDAARTHETNLIKRYRSMYGQNMLPGNKINR
ncbi:MAG TPA: hypothetical protein DEF07_04260 [Nitrosomonas sp.]|nr:hypothetical protein [Nitrosomonas sp.]